QRRGVADRGALEGADPVAAGDGHVQARDRLVLAHVGDGDLAGDVVARPHGGEEAQVQLQEHGPRPGQVLGDDGVEDRAGDPALDDDLAEAAGGGGRLVVVERVAITADGGEG